MLVGELRRERARAEEAEKRVADLEAELAILRDPCPRCHGERSTLCEPGCAEAHPCTLCGATGVRGGRPATVTLPAIAADAEDERLIDEVMARKAEGLRRRPLGGARALGRIVYDESIRAWPGDTHLVAPYEVAAPACEAAAAAVARAVLDAIRAVPWREIQDAYWTCNGIAAAVNIDEARAESVRARLLAAGEAAAEGRR